MNKLLYILFLLSAGLAFSQSAPELTNNLATNIDAADERQAWREALELWTDDSPTFTGGTYTGNLFIGGKLNVGSGAADDGHIVNFVSEEDVVTEVMLHLEWNSPTPLAGDSNALMFSMYDSALNETEYSRFRSVIEDPTDGSEDGAMTVDVLNNGVLEQAVLFSHDEIIMNDNGADRNFIVKDDDTNEVFRITGGTGSIAMDTDTLFVDSANNRVGVGDSSPSEALEVANGSVLISQADAQLKFAPRSAQNITQYIDTDVSDLLYIGDTSAGKSILFGGGYAGGMRVDAGGLTIGTGNNIEFDSNSGTWNGAALLTNTIDETAGNYEPLLDLATGYLGRYGPHQINFKNGTVDSYNGSTFAPVIDYGSQVLYDGFGTQILNWSGGIDFTSTPTLTGDFNASGQVELTGQSASTDDSAMTRSLVENLMMASTHIEQILVKVVSDSGTTGAQSTLDYITRGSARIDAGTVTSGKAVASYGNSGITHLEPIVGGGINFSNAFSVSGRFALSAIVDDHEGVIRFLFGGPNTSALADSDAFTDEGVGFEMRRVSSPATGTLQARLIHHNGTTYTAESWVTFATVASPGANGYAFLIKSDGSGGLELFLDTAQFFRPPSLVGASPIQSATGGPTGVSSPSNNEVQWVVCNSSAAYTAGMADVCAFPIKVSFQ